MKALMVLVAMLLGTQTQARETYDPVEMESLIRKSRIESHERLRDRARRPRSDIGVMQGHVVRHALARQFGYGWPRPGYYR
jgi:hypothetical protein